MIKNPKELKFLIGLSQNPITHLPPKPRQLGWTAVIEHAKRNRLIPFFSHLINCPSCQKKVPQKWLKLVKKNLLHSFFTYSIQEREKKRISKALNKQKIQLVPLKDVQAYRARGSKSIFPQKVDIDFFVPESIKEKLKALKKSMKNLGYSHRRPARPQNLLTKFDYLELDYQKRVGPVTVIVDFHLDKILPEGRGKVNPVNESANEKFTAMFIDSLRQAKGESYFLAAPELHLLFWSWHFFFRDSCRGLRTLFDLAQICQQESLDWEKTLNIANQFKLSSYFLFVVAIAQQIYKFCLPQKATRAMAKNKRVRMALKLYSPFLTAYIESPEESLNPKANKALRSYFFLIKLVLWEKSIIFKIGPRVLFYFCSYFPWVFLQLKRLNR